MTPEEVRLDFAEAGGGIADSRDLQEKRCNFDNGRWT
jgi:hypothetical protein